MPRLASLMTLALVACLLGACANVHLAGPYNQRAIEQAQRDSIEWQKIGVPERAADANARAHQLQQRVDRDEVSFTEFALSVLMDALFGGWRDAPGKH